MRKRLAAKVADMMCVWMRVYMCTGEVGGMKGLGKKDPCWLGLSVLWHITSKLPST